MEIKIRDIPDDLHRAFRLLCVGQGVSMNQALLELMRRAVAEKADLSPRKAGRK